ncbi:ATP-binding protein [Streptomyces sp. NBC_00335]|uniref:ATP-binding protein n=1 Tax=unclassified Streptomyces TaxID=2593676 RepID=UPI00225494D4|nr:MULTISPECIES: ATP-binding protein [unclassified Streptomyces]MCX5408957.1 ATP-binding protein [Streptomyces sp. NBC_00086]
MISHSRRHCVVELQALPLRIGQIRRIVSAQLRHWQLDPLIDRAALGVTELLSNVHRHAQPHKTCTVEIELRLGRLTVSVYDSDPRLPMLRDAAAAEASAAARPAGTAPVDALETSGRGLQLVEALSEAWGARQQDGRSGKVVWFSLRAAPGPAAPERHPVLLAEKRAPHADKPVRDPAPAPPVAAPLEPVSAGLSVSASVGARPG